MEQSKVIRSAFMIGGFTSISRVLGLVRDFLTAGFFGTSLPISAFVVAFRIPNLFRALFGEGALSSAFVPVFVAARKDEGDEKAWALARKVISLIGVVLLCLVVFGVVVLTFFIHRPGLGEKVAMILPLARIMLPYMFFICMAGLSMAILNSYHQFALPALTPSLLNITWITFVLVVCPRLGSTLDEQVYGLAWGYFRGGSYPAFRSVPGADPLRLPARVQPRPERSEGPARFHADGASRARAGGDAGQCHDQQPARDLDWLMGAGRAFLRGTPALLSARHSRRGAQHCAFARPVGPRGPLRSPDKSGPRSTTRSAACCLS